MYRVYCTYWNRYNQKHLPCDLSPFLPEQVNCKKKFHSKYVLYFMRHATYFTGDIKVTRNVALLLAHPIFIPKEIDQCTHVPMNLLLVTSSSLNTLKYDSVNSTMITFHPNYLYLRHRQIVSYYRLSTTTKSTMPLAYYGRLEIIAKNRGETFTFRQSNLHQVQYNF